VVSMPSVVPSLQSLSHTLQSSSRSQSLPMDPNNGSNSNLCATVITANGVEQQTV
jgi:hypothetical protein